MKNLSIFEPQIENTMLIKKHVVSIIQFHLNLKIISNVPIDFVSDIVFYGLN